MKTRRKWKRILRAGQPGDRHRRQLRGERTRVSHAATVSVQTRKYLCALRWGERLSSLGSWREGAAMRICVHLWPIIYRSNRSRPYIFPISQLSLDHGHIRNPVRVFKSYSPLRAKPVKQSIPVSLFLSLLLALLTVSPASPFSPPSFYSFSSHVPSSSVPTSSAGATNAVLTMPWPRAWFSPLVPKAQSASVLAQNQK